MSEALKALDAATNLIVKTFGNMSVHDARSDACKEIYQLLNSAKQALQQDDNTAEENQ